MLDFRANEACYKTSIATNRQPLLLARAYSAAAREDLEWRRIDFVEYDVEQDREAYARMLELTGGNRTVPVLVEEGKPVQIGWMGQGCFI